MPKRPAQVPINRRALIMRINRKLAPDHSLIITRGEHARAQMGDFWIKDCRRNAVVGKHIDLEAYARKIGVLQAFEKYEDA